jgi:uncharacterized protein
MSDVVLERMVKDYMKLGFAHAGYAWQGGEPMLMGLDFYRKAVEFQKQYGVSGQTASNALQTNAVLIDEKWGRFLQDNKFLVGISIDGPKKFHDYYRVDHAGGGTYEKVVRAIGLCKEYEVEFNILVLLNNINADHPDELFDFLVKLGTRYLQFIPCVETDPATGKIADFSVTPRQYGDFQCRIFDRWRDYGPTRLSIRDFDSIMSYCLRGRHTICTFSRQCSQYIVVEHSGDCFPCDFFVEPKWRLGSIFETPIEKLAAGDKKRAFARAKLDLCNKCMVCRHLALCRGGCMKDKTTGLCHPERSEGSGPRSEKAGFDRETYFCESYKRFFDYAMPKFMQIAAKFNADSIGKTPSLP